MVIDPPGDSKEIRVLSHGDVWR